MKNIHPNFNSFSAPLSVDTLNNPPAQWVNRPTSLKEVQWNQAISKRTILSKWAILALLPILGALNGVAAHAQSSNTSCAQGSCDSTQIEIAIANDANRKKVTAPTAPPEPDNKSTQSCYYIAATGLAEMGPCPGDSSDGAGTNPGGDTSSPGT